MIMLAGCTAPGLDAEQGAEERRTCASLRERVAARALEDGRFVSSRPPIGTDTGKVDDLGPAALAADPAAYYATLAQRLARAEFGPMDPPSASSAASRLISRCEDLGS